MPLIDVLVEMERNGIAVDPAVLKEQSAVLSERIDKLREQIIQEAGVEFNPDSPKQLGDVLFNKLGLKVIKKTKTGPSTDCRSTRQIERLARRPQARARVPQPRQAEEHLSRQPHRLPEPDDAPHPRQASTRSAPRPAGCRCPIRTCRTSRSAPTKAAASASPSCPVMRSTNVLLTADYSQIELRFLAHFTQEPALMKAFREDEDVHRTVAAEVFGVKPEDVTRQQRGRSQDDQLRHYLRASAPTAWRDASKGWTSGKPPT